MDVGLDLTFAEAVLGSLKFVSSDSWQMTGWEEGEGEGIVTDVVVELGMI